MSFWRTPLLSLRRGGCAIKEKVAEPPLWRSGVVLVKKRFTDQHHLVPSNKVVWKLPQHISIFRAGFAVASLSLRRLKLKAAVQKRIVYFKGE